MQVTAQEYYESEGRWRIQMWRRRLSKYKWRDWIFEYRQGNSVYVALTEGNSQYCDRIIMKIQER
jgi:hypothetical protein